MKLKLIGSSAVLLAFIVFSSYTLTSSDEDKNQVLMKLQLQVLDYNHYQPQELNNSFSEDVFDLYLERLDYGKRYLTQADIDRLSVYKDDLDDEARQGNYEFFDLSAEIYLKRIKEAETYYQEILAQPFDYSKDEVFDTDYEHAAYAKDEKALKEVWRKLLKYQTLTRLTNMMDRQEEALKEGDPEHKQKSFEEMEAEAREKVKKVYDDIFHRLSKTKISDLRSLYINSITNRFDPHTTYLPPQDQENFDMSISGQYSGIGAQLSDKDGKITVARIIVGSPCYRLGELEVDDEILKVAQGDEEPVDVVDMRIDDAVKLIRGKKGTEVRLTVKKLDGSIKVISIIRDVVELEATYAKSAVLQSKDSDEKVGYIYLPKFYVNFQNRDGRHCSEDVAKEIEKLKAEQVSGIILDLRNNGGGSLPDVIDMTGLFIEDGPVVQVKSRERKPHVLEDEDKSVQYDGPLVVLVNGLSASASEILAAAIQDYGRGIIMGSTTFGKGTVQQLVNLDRFVRGPGLKPLGALKYTTQKFYRVNGGATQLEGVKPDIPMPDNYRYLEYGEREQEFSMPWDEITPAPINKWVHDGTPYEQVITQSSSRIQANPTFQLIDERARMLKEQQQDHEYSLKLETYLAEKHQREADAKKYESIRQPIEGFVVASLQADLPEITQDEEKLKNREAWLKSLQKDAYIFEAMQVVKDMK